MNLISANNLCKRHGEKVLFDNVSFGINEGDKIALIGANGAGKTTLIKMIIGDEHLDSGNIAKNNNIGISYLKQVPDHDPENTIIEHILGGRSPVSTLIREYEACLEALNEQPSNSLEKQLSVLIERMDKSNAWTLESDIKSALLEFGLPNPLLQMKNLSGGMVKKVSLAQTVVKEANLLLLDEPTNHLDIETIIRLENYLIKTSKAVVIVTHDRYFLDKICTAILEIDQGQIRRYDGNYTYYLEKKSEIVNSNNREQERLQSVLRTEMEWLKRGPRARRGKSRSRTEHIYNLMDQQRFEKQDNSAFSVNERRLGKKVIELKEISKSFTDKPVIHPFSYSFKRGERIGLVGPNGSGKSTFLKMISGTLQPDTGIIDRGINTHIGYFDQMSEAMSNDQTVIEYLKEAAEHVVQTDGGTIEIPQLLERFAFDRNKFYTRLRYLSGGERRRLYLVRVLILSPNFLIFDEPTNDFDIKTLSMLEDFLSNFQGCLLVVSHDRYFLDRTIDYLFVFDGKANIYGFGGNYNDYMEFLKEKEEESLSDKQKVKKDKSSAEKRKLTFKEQKEYESLLSEIEALEIEKENIEKQFSSQDIEPDKMRELHIRYKTIEKSIEERMLRWEELGSIAEG